MRGKPCLVDTHAHGKNCRSMVDTFARAHERERETLATRFYFLFCLLSITIASAAIDVMPV